MSVLKTVTGKRPKLIGTDLDGTIVAHYGFISERTKIAFAAAHAIQRAPTGKSAREIRIILYMGTSTTSTQCEFTFIFNAQRVTFNIDVIT